MYGIIDCDNCYCSAEKVFRPDLEGKPIVVLSNNDGCVVARSNEAKKLGIKAGTPYFQLAQQFPNQKIAVFSSNYELYGELTGRIVSIISKEVPAYFRNSIDECFVNIYRTGYQYKKAGVIVMGIGPGSPIQQDLFDINAEQFQKMKRLDEVVDRINRMLGSETIVLGSQQYTKKDGKGKADVFANAIKHDFKSPNPTTRWSDIIKLR